MPVKKIPISYDDYVRGIELLTYEQQIKLIQLISSNLQKTFGKTKRKHSIMELQGLGAEIWKGVDAQEYVKKERESWD